MFVLPCIVVNMLDKNHLDVIKNAGIFTEHVSGTSIPIFTCTLVISAFWCPNMQRRRGCVALGCVALGCVAQGCVAQGCSMCVVLRGCGPNPLSSRHI
jgi:hypothetical protein